MVSICNCLVLLPLTFFGAFWFQPLFMLFYECVGEFHKRHYFTLEHNINFNFTLSNTRDESCEGALIIHKILQNKPAFMLNEETFYNKMKSFTLQILNRKKV